MALEIFACANFISGLQERSLIYVHLKLLVAIMYLSHTQETIIFFFFSAVYFIYLLIYIYTPRIGLSNYTYI